MKILKDYVTKIQENENKMKKKINYLLEYYVVSLTIYCVKIYLKNKD